MRRIVVVLTGLLTVAGCSAGPGEKTEREQQLLPRFIGLRTHRGVAGFEDGERIAADITRLSRRSPTFSGMLEALDTVPGLKILLNPAVALVEGLESRGTTVLRPSPASFAAWTEIPVDHLNPEHVVEAVAHEFGHITEAACVGHYRSLNELRTVLDQRSSSPDTSRASMSETPFTLAVATAIVDEWNTSPPSESRFDGLAMRYGLWPCRASGRIARR